jgi:hypothetical protein
MHPDVTVRVRRHLANCPNPNAILANDLRDAANEIEVLRHVVRSLHEQGRIINGPMPWMRHSPADEAYDRALGRDGSGDKPEPCCEFAGLRGDYRCRGECGGKGRT